MPKSPEQFDFSKQEDQEKFDKLPEQEQSILIEKSQQEALKISEKIIKLKELGMSFEEAEIASDSLISGENLEEAIKTGRIKSRLNFITKEFSEKDAEKISESEKSNLKKVIEELAESLSGYTTHWDIEISSAESFFDNMSSFLKQWELTHTFRDKKTLHLVANEATDLFLEKEKERKFPFIDTFHGSKRVYHTDPQHISSKEISAGDLMRDLGFYEDALSLYYKAKGTVEQYYKGTPRKYYSGAAAEDAAKKIRVLFVKYKESGEQSEKMDKEMGWAGDSIVDTAKRNVKEGFPTPPGYDWEYNRSWEKDLTKAKNELSEIGFSKEEQDKLLREAYIEAIRVMIAEHHNAKEKRPDLKITTRMNDIIKLYRVVGEDKKASEWELKYLNLQAEDLRETIEKSLTYAEMVKIKQSRNEIPLYSAKEWGEFIERDKDKLEQIETRISELESKK